MRNRAILAVSLLTVMVAACGSSEQAAVIEQIVVRSPGDGAPPIPADVSSNPANRMSDLFAAGEDAFQMCSGCHVVEAGAPSSAGPNLYGVVGRQIGSSGDYPYSDALLAADAIWDEASLDQYLADPGGYLPGTEMLAGAVADDETRAAIVAYLASNSAATAE